MKMIDFNPMQILNAISRSTNPMQMLMQYAQNTPAVKQAMQATNGKTPSQVHEMACKMARERGMDLDAFMRELGIPQPK